MTPEERETLLDSLIDLMTTHKLGGWRRDVAPFVEAEGTFGFYCGHKDEGATTAAVLSTIFEKAGLAPGATRDADYLVYRNLGEGRSVEASDYARVVNDEDIGFRFECRAPLPVEALVEAIEASITSARDLRRREARGELATIEKNIYDRKRDKITEVFSAAQDKMFVSAYLIQYTEAFFEGATADVIPQPERWSENSCTVITTDVAERCNGGDFDKECAFRWKLSEVFNSAGAVGCHAEDPGLLAVRITGTKARLALDILDNDLEGARKAAATVVKQLGKDAASFKAKYDMEDGKRAAELAARQGTAKPITIGGPIKLKQAQ